MELLDCALIADCEVIRSNMVFSLFLHRVICHGTHWKCLSNLPRMFLWRNKKNEPGHDKTYNEACVTSKDSDQPLHLPSEARVLICPSLDIPDVVEGTCCQLRLI